MDPNVVPHETEGQNDAHDIAYEYATRIGELTYVVYTTVPLAQDHTETSV
jgi:hypothetical protein